ncbi:class I SAM-dependent methyltransferase [Streptomyces sp. NPDC051567]|uniref:class I SAM-dependent methyltransferase n=1 Tax=Streptomyces sp. NPDC051567 TaxID=3365660 RepID=UPI0037B28321
MAYGPDHAGIYDLVFRSRGKDFAAETEALTQLIRSRFPGAGSLLDVACGTGAHLEAFGGHFARTEGLEYAEAMRQAALERLPEVPVHAGDMRRFALEGGFDAVTCLGNSVACVESAAELDEAIGCMARHLVPGGVLVVEPWWFPDNFIDGYVGGHVAREEGRVVARVTRATRVGDRTRHEVRFVVADSEGMREFSDVLMVGLFTRAAYEEAFERAGCTVEFVPPLSLADGRPNSPGLFVGIRK